MVRNGNAGFNGICYTYELPKPTLKRRFADEVKIDAEHKAVGSVGGTVVVLSPAVKMKCLSI